LSKLVLKKALTELGEEVSDSTLRKSKADTTPIDFEAFVKYADQARAERVQRERKKAGFTDEKIAQFRETFDRIDKDKSAIIDTKELNELLKEFGWEPHTKEEQAALKRKLDLARQRAREAGVKDVSPDGFAGIKFWPFIQLARMLATEQEQAEEEKMSVLMSEIKFNQREVEEFRQVYLDRKRRCQKELEVETELEGLPRDAVRRLIRQLGAKMTSDGKAAVDDQLDALGCTLDSGGLLEFAGFLRLMRWLVDSGWLAV